MRLEMLFVVAAVLLGGVPPASATPAEAERLRARAGKALERKDYKEAAELLEKAHKADPKKHAILKDLAVVYAGDGKIDEAAAKYREYLKAVPRDEAAFLAMATTLSWGKEQRQRDESEKLLTEYLTKHPDSDDALIQRARVRSWSGKVDEAEVDYKAYLAKHPNEEKVKLELAQALSSKKDPAAFARAIAIYDAHLAANPNDKDILLQRARVHSWANQIPEAVSDYRAYLKMNPNDEGAQGELARALSWSPKGTDQGTAIEIFDQRLKAHPEDTDALLGRARAYSASKQSDKAIADFRAYLKLKPDDDTARLELARLLAASSRQEDRKEALATIDAYAAKHPDDERVPLEVASILSASKEKASLDRAIAIYNTWLKKHPDDKEILLQRARVNGWAGNVKEAEADFRAYGQKSPNDDSYLLELANAISQGPNPGDALSVYDQYLAKHPDNFEAKSRRARTLLWIGDYNKAEAALDGLRFEAKNDQQKSDVEVDLARLYAQTNRRYHALDLLDEVLARDAKNEAARAERERIAMFTSSRIEPKIFAYDDKSGIRIISLTVDSRVTVSKNVAVVTDVGGWSLGTAQETFFAGRANVGAWTRIKFLELEAAAGPRFYEFFDPKFGARAWARVSPTGWVSALLQYQYDDIYFDMLQPASVSAGIRGHGVFLTGDVTLPIQMIRVVGRLGTRALNPDNNSLEASGTVMVPIVRPLSVGYTTQFISWRYNDPSYWSPQEFAAHLGVIRLAQTFYRSGFGYDVQGVLGIAGERILGTPEAGFGPSFGGSGAIIYSPFPRLELRLTAQYSQTVREIPGAVVGGSTGAGTTTAPRTKRDPSKYYWILGTASAIVYF